MENRKLPETPMHDETSVQVKGHDYEPLLTTDKPKVDNPPTAYDCKVERPDSPRSGKQD